MAPESKKNLEVILNAFGFVALIIGGGIGSVYLSNYLSKRARALRSLRAKPIVELGNLSENQHARVIGQVVYSVEPLQAPVSGRDCVCYEVILEQYRSGRPGYWHEVAREQQFASEFVLEQPNQHCMVSISSSELLVHIDFNVQTFKAPTAASEAFAKRHGHKTQGTFLYKVLRFREGIIEAGEEIAVYGKCKLELDPTAEHDGYRGRVMRPRLGAPDREPMVISDEPEVLRRK